MRLKFYIVDVFSPTAFGGNQLAVLPEAQHLSTQGMQAVAREFNFVESTFVLPAENAGETCRVRIFTPEVELPFAGHPTIGTACALVRGGHVPVSAGQAELVLGEKVGLVKVSVQMRGEELIATLKLDKPPEVRSHAPHSRDVAEMLGLTADQVLSSLFASAGVPFCCIRLKDKAAVDAAKLNLGVWSEVLADAWSPHVFIYSGETVHGSELYARMFAPALGVEG